MSRKECNQKVFDAKRVIGDGDSHPDKTLNSLKQSVKFSAHAFLLNAHTSIPVLFFNLSFYLAFCPFKFKKNEDGVYVTDTKVVQQVICLFVTVTSILHRFTETRLYWPGVEGNPVAYFALFFNLSNLLLNVALWYTLWFKCATFLHLVTFLQSKATFPNSKLRVKATVGGSVIYIASTIIALLCFFFGTDVLHKSHWNPPLLFKCFANHAKYMIFITNDEERVSEAGELTQVEVLMAILYGASHFFRRIVGLYENILTAIGPLTLWIATTEFITSLSPDGKSPEKWHIVYQRYDDLRKLTDIVNDLFGPLFMSHFATAFFFYSCNFDNFITGTDGFIRLKFFAYYLIFILTLLLASDICRQLSCMEPWISANLKEDALGDLDQLELTLVLHELQVKRISMSGCGSFSMTYSLSGQLAGAIITYFIISLQYRSPDTSV